MKGERTPCRFGLHTNKSIKRGDYYYRYIGYVDDRLTYGFEDLENTRKYIDDETS